MTADRFGHGPNESRLRMQTIIRLRWFGVGGQLITVIGVYWGLGFDLPVGLCFALIAFSAWVNVFLRVRYPARHRLSSIFATSILAYDILELAALLYLTGGLENPFAFLFLVPVTISATSLSLQWTLSLGATAFLCATFLAFSHYPLPWLPGQPLTLPDAYIVGMWTAIICGVVTVTYRSGSDANHAASACVSSPSNSATRACRRMTSCPRSAPSRSGPRRR